MSATSALALTDPNNELQPLQEFSTDMAMTRAMHEVQGAIIVAQRFKRNEDEIYQSLMRSCKRTSFAERAEYKYERGSKKNPDTGEWEKNYVQGPSVYLSREMVRLWGNIQVGTEIIRDDDDTRHIRSFAWDVQTNAKRFKEASFRKLIQRKKKVKDQKTGKMKDAWPPETEWVRPDERDLRELTNKQGAICERNASLELMPDDFVYDARMEARNTILNEAKIDPDAVKKKVLSGFDSINVAAADLEIYLGHAIATCSPAELTDLRQLYAAIAEGNTTWKEIMDAKTGGESDVVTADQANEFFQTYMASGWKAPQASAWLDKAFKVKDGRKIPVDGFEKAMEWAKSKPSDPAPKTEAKPEVKGEVISPNKNAAPEQAALVLDSSDPTQNKIAQLFDILETPEKMRKNLLHDYAGRLGDLASELEGQLPQD
jgi:hypothetical protein